MTYLDFQDSISAFNWRVSSMSLFVCVTIFWLSFMTLRDSSVSSLSFWDSSAILSDITLFLWRIAMHEPFKKEASQDESLPIGRLRAA